MFCKNCGKEIDNNAVVCPGCGVATDNFKANSAQEKASDSTPNITIVNTNTNTNKNENVNTVPVATRQPKSKKTALILCLLGLFGVAGLHQFYAGRIGKGILYLLTYGLFFIGTIVDIIKILSGSFKDKYGVAMV